MELTKLRFAPSATMKVAKKLMYGSSHCDIDGLVPEWAGTDFTDDENKKQFLSHLSKFFPDISIEVLHESCSSLFAMRSTKREALEVVCWRLASHRDSLISGRAVPVWSGLVGQVAAPLQVVHTKNEHRTFKAGVKNGAVLQFMVIDGPACPTKLSCWYPNKFLYVLARELGLSSRNPKMRYGGHAAELYGMRFVGVLTTDIKRVTTLTRYAVGQFAAHNKQLLKSRAEPCPIAYTWPCWACSLGESACPACPSRACRKDTMTKQFCETCKAETWHGPNGCVVGHQSMVMIGCK